MEKGRQKLEKELRKLKNPQKAKIYQRFFKTGKGEYGEGDIFLGLTVPQCREIVKKYFDPSLKDVLVLLKSKIHEHRWAVSMILSRQYQKADEKSKKEIASFYLKNSKRFNNWDLVDGTAPNILGEWLVGKDKSILYKFAKSDNLWERRIAIMATFAFIKNNQFEDTFEIAEMLLADSHDLIHKAVGWMLREVGKHDLTAEEKFLKKHYWQMPRTMLRYAIEKFPQQKRRLYLVK